LADQCLVCGASDPLGLAVCADCGGTDASVADRLLFVLPASHRRERRAQRERLAVLTGRTPRAEAVDSTVRGLRALAMVPAASAATIAARLGTEGITTNAVRPVRTWAAVPLSFWLLVAAATVSGLQAGRVGPPSLLLLTPIFTATLVWSAIRSMRRPLHPAVLPSRRAVLPPALLRVLVELPPGLARDHLAGLAQVARRVLEEEGLPSAMADQVRELMPVAAEAARELDHLERTFTDFSVRTRGPGDLPADFQRALEELQVARGRLIGLLLEVTGLVGRLQGLSADGLDSAGERLAELTRDLTAGAGFIPPLHQPD
jgi:hypothetical protein